MVHPAPPDRAGPQAADFQQRLATLAADLRLLRLEHGNLPLRAIARRSPRERPLSISAVSETFTGKRLPRLDFFMALVRTLLGHDAEGRPCALHRDDPRVEHWRARWRDLELLRAAGPTSNPALIVNGPASANESAWPVVPVGPGPANAIAPISYPRRDDDSGPPFEPAGEPLRLPSAISAMAIGPGGRLLTTVGNDGTGRLWDYLDGRLVRLISAQHAGGTRAVAFHVDGELIVTAGRDHMIRRWTIAGEQAGDQLAGHTASVEAVAVCRDGRLLASASMDRTVRLWDVVTGQSIGAALIGHTSGVDAVAFSPDGAILASSSMDGTVRLWDTRSGKPVAEPLTGHTGFVRSVAFAADGGILASAGWDGTVRLWEAATGRAAGPILTGHTNAVRSVAFAPIGGLLATAGMDSTIRIWNSATGRQLGAPITGHVGGVKVVAFTPDGDLLISAGADKTVQVWQPRSRPATW